MPFVVKFGDLKGESKVTGFEEHTEILSWSFGGHQPTSGLLQGGLTSSHANMSDVNIVKRVDGTSINIIRKMIRGFHFEEIVVIGTKTTGTDLGTYLMYTFKKCLITSVSQSGAGDDVPMENVTFNYKSMELVNTLQVNEGSVEGDMDIKFDFEIYDEV